MQTKKLVQVYMALAAIKLMFKIFVSYGEIFRQSVLAQRTIYNWMFSNCIFKYPFYLLIFELQSQLAEGIPARVIECRISNWKLLE
jgi:hypothetical protein